MPLDRMSPEDAAILALESPTIAGHTCKVVVLEPALTGAPDLDVAALRARIAAGLDAAPRLRRRPAPTPFGLARPAWVDDAEFDLARHVRRYPVAPDPLDDAAVAVLAARAMEERLDRAHPLWSLELAQAADGGRAALVWKLHHALADGTEALRLAEAVLWDREPAPPVRPDARWTPEPAPGTAALVAAALRERAGDLAGGAARAARGSASPAAWRGAAREARRLPGAVARDLLPERFASPLDARPGVRRDVSFAALALDEIKRIEHAQPQRTTVNDVLLALVAGALRRWMAHHGEAPHELRAKVPVSLHDRHAHPDALANRDSFLCVALPLAEPDPVARLSAIAAETRLCKREHDPETLDAFFGALRHASRPVARLAARLASGPRTFALEISNVPGPADPRWVVGRRVGAVRSLAEIGERHALRITAISYAGTVHVGLCADAGAVQDAPVLAAGMQEEARELLRRVS